MATPKKPAKLNAQIIGGSGLRQIGGFVYEDFLAQLNGLQGVRMYREMEDNDPIIGALLLAITSLLRGVEWRVEPADETAAAQEAADFVEECLFEDMSHPFGDFVGECLSFLPYGFSAHEIVWKIRGGMDTTDSTRRSRFTDNRIGIRKLAGRAQDTVWKWSFQDDGGVDGLYQMLPYGNGTTPLNVFIPVEKLLIFRTQTRKNNPEGRSILRNSYIQYVRKQVVESAEGRIIMRTAGIAELRIPGMFLDVGASPEEKAVAAAYEAMAANLGQDKQGSLLLPSDTDEHGKPKFEFKYTSTSNTRATDTNAVVERYDKRIATAALADFLLLGQAAVGSFALSSDKTALFAASLKAYNDIIAGVLNRILLQRLWHLNQFDYELMPKLVPGDVQSTSLTELGGFVSQLAAAGMPLFPDEQLEGTLREIGHMPPPSGEARSSNPNITPPEPDPNDPDAKVEKDLELPLWRQDDVEFTRPPTDGWLRRLAKRLRATP